jgi:hypothetical protein
MHVPSPLGLGKEGTIPNNLGKAVQLGETQCPRRGHAPKGPSAKLTYNVVKRKANVKRET